MTGNEERELPPEAEAPSETLRKLQERRDSAASAYVQRNAAVKIAQETADLRAIIALENEYGPVSEGCLAELKTRYGSIILKAPDPLVHRKYSETPESKTTTNTQWEYVRSCVVHPDPLRFDEIFKLQSAILGPCVTLCLNLGGYVAIELEKKSVR
jgi:hypothetical protein